MARAFDNAVSDRQSLRFEIFQRCLDILSLLERGDQARGIIRGFRNACGDVWPPLQWRCFASFSSKPSPQSSGS